MSTGITRRDCNTGQIGSPSKAFLLSLANLAFSSSGKDATGGLGMPTTGVGAGSPPTGVLSGKPAIGVLGKPATGVLRFGLSLGAWQVVWRLSLFYRCQLQHVQAV